MDKLEKLMQDIDQMTDDAFMDEPEDVRRLLTVTNCNLGHNFPVWAFQYCELWMMKSVLFTYYNQLRGNEADFETVKASILALIRGGIGYAGSTKFLDYKEMLLRTVDEVVVCESRDDLATLIRKVQFYAATIFASLDIAMPWEEVGNAYTKIMAEYTPVTRKNK